MEIVADLRELDRATLEDARELDERTSIGRCLDEIWRCDQRQSGYVLQMSAHTLGVSGRCVDTSADGGGAHVDLANQRLRFTEPVYVLEHGVRESVEFLAERHRNCILE